MVTNDKSNSKHFGLLEISKFLKEYESIYQSIKLFFWANRGIEKFRNSLGRLTDEDKGITSLRYLFSKWRFSGRPQKEFTGAQGIACPLEQAAY